MPGKILTKVLSTNDKGLIGTTEDGEEVALSEPNPQMETKRYEESYTESLMEKFRKDVRGIIEKSCGEGAYVQLAKINYFLGDGLILQIYNVYTRRE